MRPGTLRRMGLLVVLGCVFLSISIAEDRPAEAPPRSGNRLGDFVLKDQFGVSEEHRFPADRPVVLLAADRKGYQTLDPWIVAAREQWIDQATILGVADMRAVPGFLREKVARRFRSAGTYPVLLDWEGEVMTSLDPEPRTPNVYLISRTGAILLHLSGDATASKLDALGKALRDTSPSEPASAPH